MSQDNYVFTPPKPASLPVAGGDERFPIRRVYCVGRNYAAHAVEMGHDPDKEPPFFFQKNPDNVTLGGDFTLPAHSQEVHYEIELVVAIGKGGRDISTQDAMSHVYGYAVGLDMTLRDLQSQAKKMGRPWEIGKAFEKSAPCSPIVRKESVDVDNGAVWLKVNGDIKQEGDLNQLIWKIPEVIEHLSGVFELAPGDIIMTGTPAGVGAVKKGDTLQGHVDGVGDIHLKVV
ncbi:fumarylacetoacetate hydrolase family protein [Halomonas sp. ML-15]|uniref:fumarylacetoacetate hydrolase family protein n=1 Tax=Halomonas sp. ML-15 TaxID=2773305 RepID=UPI0017472823|nr:fumarylacetoacetate hydrolase family protein [Halomonas sp. ML-15]MBD3894608.1 fumarylacetoacetate hydrolase family protein [Halomonas sp. ML-15]